MMQILILIVSEEALMIHEIGISIIYNRIEMVMQAGYSKWLRNGTAIFKQLIRGGRAPPRRHLSLAQPKNAQMYLHLNVAESTLRKVDIEPMKDRKRNHPKNSPHLEA
jgi:hypothetical protein